MNEISEFQDYRQKWLEAERELAMNWAEPPSNPPCLEPVDNINIDKENIDKDIERISKSLLVSRNLE